LSRDFVFYRDKGRFWAQENLAMDHILTPLLINNRFFKVNKVIELKETQ